METYIYTDNNYAEKVPDSNNIGNQQILPQPQQQRISYNNIPIQPKIKSQDIPVQYISQPSYPVNNITQQYISPYDAAIQDDDIFQQHTVPPYTSQGGPVLNMKHNSSYIQPQIPTMQKPTANVHPNIPFIEQHSFHEPPTISNIPTVPEISEIHSSMDDNNMGYNEGYGEVTNQ